MDDVTMEGTPLEGATTVEADLSRSQSEEKLSARQKYGWAVGGLAELGLSYGVMAWALPIYNIGLGVSTVWLGWALAIPRLLDGIIDPWIGNMSDNTRTRWGRRRPFILAGAIVSAVAFAAVWLPPLSLSKTGLFVWYLVTTIVMFIGYAFFSIGYSALGLELSPNSSERAKAIGVKVIGANIMVLGLAWGLPISKLDVFSGNTVIGIRYIGVITAIIVLVTGLLPALLCREQTESISQPKMKFWPAFRDTIKLKPFLNLTCVGLLIMVGTLIVAPMNLYILIHHISSGNEKFAFILNGYSSSVYSILGLALPVFIVAAGIKWGKKRTLCAGIILQLLGYISTWFLFTPKYPWLSMCVYPMISIGGIALGVFIPAMMADICDIDELNTGLRREGMFGAVSAFIGKLTVALVTVLSGYLLAFSGYVAKQTPSEHTILMMRFLFMAFPCVLLLLSLVLALRYPITDRYVKEARILLDARKQASQSSAEKSSEV